MMSVKMDGTSAVSSSDKFADYITVFILADPDNLCRTRPGRFSQASRITVEDRDPITGMVFQEFAHAARSITEMAVRGMMSQLGSCNSDNLRSAQVRKIRNSVGITRGDFSNDITARATPVQNRYWYV